MTRDACDVTGEGCEMTRDACDVTGEGCEMTRDACDVTGEGCLLNRNACEMTRDGCLLNRDACDVTGADCDLKRGADQRTRPHIGNIFVVATLGVGDYALVPFLGRCPRLVCGRAFGPQNPTRATNRRRGSSSSTRSLLPRLAPFFRANGASIYQPGATPQDMPT
jgi:hypothetical protein